MVGCDSLMAPNHRRKRRSKVFPIDSGTLSPSNVEQKGRFEFLVNCFVGTETSKIAYWHVRRRVLASTFLSR